MMTFHFSDKTMTEHLVSSYTQIKKTSYSVFMAGRLIQKKSHQKMQTTNLGYITDHGKGLHQRILSFLAIPDIITKQIPRLMRQKTTNLMLSYVVTSTKRRLSFKMERFTKFIIPSR